MTHRSKWPGLYALALLLAAGALSFAGLGGSAPARAVPGGSAVLAMSDLVGTWEGTWTDTIFMSETYDMTWEITQVREGYSATGMIDFKYFSMGEIYGTADGTVTVGLRADTLHFTFEGTGIGAGSGTVTGGIGAGSGSVFSPFTANFTFQGTVTDTLIRGTFDFPTGGSGWARMAKQETPVEPSSWGGIKARYRDGAE